MVSHLPLSKPASSIEDIDALLQESKAPINEGYLKVVSYATQTKEKMEATLKKNIIYVGLDVDDTPYYGSALDKDDLIASYGCRPGLAANLEYRSV
jgi:hypothetical protein